MDQQNSGKPGPGGSTGDLWKKVLDEVQIEAAARRSKVAARSAAAPNRSSLELDLLKRILVAIETKPAPQPVVTPQPIDRTPELLGEIVPEIRAQIQAIPRPADPTPALREILDAVRATPALDPREIVGPLVEAIERSRPTDQLAALRQELAQQIAAIPQSIPAPADVSPLLQAIVEAVRAQPKLQPQEIISPIVEAIERNNPAGEREASRDLITRQLGEQIQLLVAAMPKPVDPTPQLDAILQALRSQPAPASGPAVDVDALVQRITESNASLKPADVTGDLQQLRAELAAMPKPVDATAKLEEILAATRQRPDDGRDEVLLQILEAVQQPKSAADPKLDDLSRQIAAIAAAMPKEQSATAAVDSLRRDIGAQLALELSSQLAALPKPVDAAPQLQAVLEAVGKQPVGDVEGALRRVMAETKVADAGGDNFAQLTEQVRVIGESNAQLAERISKQLETLANASAQPNPALDEIQKLLQAKATQSDEALLWRILQAVEQPPKKQASAADTAQLELLQQIHATVTTAAATPAAPALDQVVSQLRGELALQTTGVHEELARLREAIGQSIAQQSAAVREDVLAQSIEVIDQIKSQSPAGVEESLRQLRAEIAAIPRQTDDGSQWKAGVESILAAIRNQPVPQPVDGAVLVEQLRSVMPVAVPAPTIDTAALITQIREAVAAAAPSSAPVIDVALLVEQLRTAMPAPEIPSFQADFAKQGDLLRQLLTAVRTQPAPQRDGAIDDLRSDVQALADTQRQTQAIVEKSLAAFTTKLESKLESKLNTGLAKIELAIATADTGRPSAVLADGSTPPPAQNYSYSWMNQASQRSRGPMVAMTVIAVAAVGMFLVLLINALSGNGNDNANNGASLASNGGNTNDRPPTTGANSTNSSKSPLPDPAKAGTSATTPGPVPKASEKSAPALSKTDEKGTFDVFPKASGNNKESPIVDPQIFSEIRNLANPTATGGRVVYELAQAREVVFLVHSTTGSPAALTTILAELKKTMAQVKPMQKFTVVFSEGRRSVEAPPGGLREASESERNRVENWIDVNVRSATVRAATNPLVAMDVALSYSPDLLWIVSDGLAGDGEGQVASKEILDRIATFNPNGLIHIAATQVGPADAANTLKTLAEKYGGAFVAAGDGGSASRVP